MELLFTGILFSLGFGILVAIHICIIGRAFRPPAERSTRSKSKSKLAMSKEELKKLPCFDFEEGEGKEEGGGGGGGGVMDCAVCLENFKNGDKCRLLPNCSHSFHVQCIDSWLLKTPFCPVCRACAAASTKPAG